LESSSSSENANVEGTKRHETTIRAKAVTDKIKIGLSEYTKSQKQIGSNQLKLKDLL